MKRKNFQESSRNDGETGQTTLIPLVQWMQSRKLLYPERSHRGLDIYEQISTPRKEC